MGVQTKMQFDFLQFISRAMNYQFVIMLCSYSFPCTISSTESSYTLHLLGIASKSRLCYINGMSGTVFVGMFMIYFHTKFHMPRIGTLLVVVIKPKAELGLQNSRKSHILLNITKKLHEQSHYAGAINNGKFKVQSWALCASCHFTLLINFFF